jgi:hypothetical protein
MRAPFALIKASKRLLHHARLSWGNLVLIIGDEILPGVCWLRTTDTELLQCIWGCHPAGACPNVRRPKQGVICTRSGLHCDAVWCVRQIANLCYWHLVRHPQPLDRPHPVVLQEARVYSGAKRLAMAAMDRDGAHAANGEESGLMFHACCWSS